MKTLLNYQIQNEVSKANFNTVKRIYNRPPFMKVVYREFTKQERHKRKGLMSKTMAVHVRYKSLYIFLPSSS